MNHRNDVAEVLAEQAETIKQQEDRIVKLTNLLLQYMTQEEIDSVT
jgi:hypothetical protein